ncbi:MAG: YfhO family protein [bacterium]|nr:YfhO family protein [bacterium]
MPGSVVKRDTHFLILLCLLVIAFFSHTLFTDTMFCFRDFYRLWYPVMFFTHQCLYQGLGLPLWNPYAFGGTPTVADMSLYPPSILTYLPNFNLGLKWFVVSHYLAAACGMYLLSRELKTSCSGAFMAAISFVFGGYLLGILDMLNTLTSASLMPFVFLFFHRYLIKNSFSSLATSGGMMVLFLLSGDVTVVYGMNCILLCYSIHQCFVHKNFSPLKKFLLVMLIGCGLSLFKIIPVIEAIINSSRAAQGIIFKEASLWAFSPLQIVEFIVPFFADILEPTKFQAEQTWLSCPYFGLLPFIFLCLAVVNRQQKKYSFFTFAFLIFLILSFGNILPLYYWCYKILPGFSLFRFPVKFLCIVAFSGSLLSGFGLDIVLESKKLLRFLKYILLVLLAIFLIICIAGSNYYEFILTTLLPNIKGEDNNVLFIRFYHIICNTTLSSIFLSIILLSLWRIKTKTLLLPVLFCIIISDLFLAGFKYQPTMKEKYFFHYTKTVEFINTDKEIFRVMHTPAAKKHFAGVEFNKNFVLNYTEYQRGIVPYLGLSHHIFYTHVSGYMALCPGEYMDLIALFMTYPPILEVLRELINLFNIKYIISVEELTPELVQNNWKLVYNKGIYIYKNETAFPRAFFVPEAVSLAPGKVFDTVGTMNFDPRNQVILGEDAGDSRQKPADNKQIHDSIHKPVVKITDYKLHSVSIKADTNMDGWIVLTDNYYPGWKAYVNNRETKIYRANHAFRAIKIKSGTSKIDFVYDPLSFKTGIWGSIISLIFIAGMGILSSNKSSGV